MVYRIGPSACTLCRRAPGRPALTSGMPAFVAVRPATEFWPHPDGGPSAGPAGALRGAARGLRDRARAPRGGAARGRRPAWGERAGEAPPADDVRVGGQSALLARARG